MANLGFKENKMMKIRIIQFIIIPLALLAVHIGCTKKEPGKNNLIDFGDSHSIKSQKPILIAHRGGVITTQSPECSIAAIRLAKQQDYAMVELDIQKSKDHVPIVFHDNDMKKACGINKSIKDLNADEIIKIAYVNTDQTICTLDQALSICRSLKLGLMLDVKITGDEKFFQKIVIHSFHT
jgi:glycerophosphoryl diester phosphodiesterase